MRSFLAYLAQRVVQFVFVVFAGVTLAFAIAHLSPVDPVEQSLTLLTNVGASDPKSVSLLRDALSQLYGVNGSMFEQYVGFWRRILSFDFGPSLSAFPTPVMQIILRAMPWTAGLLISSTLLAWLLGNLLGALAGYYRNNRLLKTAGIVVMAVQPIPTYILGLALLILFGFLWPVLPISGGAEINLPPGLTGAFLLSLLQHAILPTATLTLVNIGGWFVSMRSLVSNIVTEDHVVYAELAWVPSRTIFSMYVARNAMLPQVTGLALRLGHMFGGAVIVEFLFAYPGMGQLLISGITAGDYSLVLGVTTISIVAVALSVFFIDLLYPLIDPRVKLA